MGIYLNSASAYTLYENETKRPYFVDKTLLLKQLFPLTQSGNSHICITRPRRFGKTIMANMAGAFFGKGADSKVLFDSLKIAEEDGYSENLNQYDVVYIDFSKMPKDCMSYNSYISRIENRLYDDLEEMFPKAGICRGEALWDILEIIFNRYGGQKFIFILDEWDYIFHRDFITKKEEQQYLIFLSNLLKDRPYVLFSYMTGILPIAKYSSGSELNMFMEYTMAGEEKFSEDFGFTEEEVDELYERYLKYTTLPKVSREGLRLWYDGYYIKTGKYLYNPRSVVASLTNNNLGSYWTSSGPYDEIFYYVERNVAEVREDLALMTAGEAVPAKVREYAATSMDLTTRDEIFSAMVVYGFLSCEKGMVRIPNKELMDKFDAMLLKESSLGYVHRLAKESDKMLRATLAGDIETMENILDMAHNTEVPMLSYNHETELAAIVNLVYLSARDSYRVEREEKAGKGFVDFIFYPYERKADCIIIELKVDETPETAVKQIREKQYPVRFRGKIGESKWYTGRILLVGIGYDKKTKEHRCIVEECKDTHY